MQLKQLVWELQIVCPETTSIGNGSRKLGIANIVHPWCFHGFPRELSENSSNGHVHCAVGTFHGISMQVPLPTFSMQRGWDDGMCLLGSSRIIRSSKDIAHGITSSDQKFATSHCLYGSMEVTAFCISKGRHASFSGVAHLTNLTHPDSEGVRCL